MKLRTERAIRMEYRRVVQAKPKTGGENWQALVGAQQALAWALDDNAMVPARCYLPPPPKRKQEPQKP